jgi:hypothetical protein
MVGLLAIGTSTYASSSPLLPAVQQFLAVGFVHVVGGLWNTGDFSEHRGLTPVATLRGLEIVRIL